MAAGMPQRSSFNEWFAALGIVDITTLEEDDRSCGICYQDFSSEHGPVRLPCSHIFVSYYSPTFILQYAAYGAFAACLRLLRLLVLGHEQTC